jgi:protocatechuate 3,4-dioxygenase beta subunit
MDALHRITLTRRELLAASAASAVAFAACSDDDDSPSGATSTSEGRISTSTAAPAEASVTPQGQTLAPTPECVDADDPTPEQTEGPFFSPNSPERTSLLEASVTGTRLVLAGSVLSTACAPLSGALIEFWQADDDGNYDNEGFKLRGHQFSDAQGRYTLTTILPGLYPGRTRHIHVKVQPEGGRMITSQLYFPGEPGNAGDGIFNDALVMDVRDAADGQEATFDFVLQL